MTYRNRPTSIWNGSQSPAQRLPVLALQLSAAILVFFVLLVSSAGAVANDTTEAGPVGLEPRNVANVWVAPFGNTFANPEGRPVLHSAHIYPIFWDPTDHYHADWQHLIDTYFRNLGEASGSLASDYAVDAQYDDATNQPATDSLTSMGSYTDTDAYPTTGQCTDPHPLAVLDRIGPEDISKQRTPVCLTNTQIHHELETFIANHEGAEGMHKGMGNVFVLLTPPGVSVCLDGGGATTGHCSDFKGTVQEIETDEKAKLLAESKKETYTAPEQLVSYEHSFCSYHSDISPTNTLYGDERTILYVVVPWIAGGEGDGDLFSSEDRTPAYDCQDGGFDPTSKPIEQREVPKEKRGETKEEKERGKTIEEEEKEAEQVALEGPHEQEPNQLPCRTEDGYCDTGLADIIISQVGSELQNMVTNPLLNAWENELGDEAADECRNFFAPTTSGGVAANEETGAGTLANQKYGDDEYYVNNAFNLAALNLPFPGIPCLHDIELNPRFTAPNPVKAEELVGFNGMESSITLDVGTAYTSSNGKSEPKATYAKYAWNFGDGSPEVVGYAPGAPSANSPATQPCEAPWLTPCAASVYHSYKYGGVYEVTLTVTDVAGHQASITNAVEVEGPPAPSSGSGGQGSGSSATSSATTGAVAAPASTPQVPPTSLPTLPEPVVSTRVLSKLIPAVAAHGLIARYAVNEEVAGGFDVLLNASVAKRLGIHGQVAAGLPAGTPKSIIIAHALVVTTRAGRSTIKIKFSKHTAAGLRKAGKKITLMLRLQVRNGEAKNPKTATVLSTVTLHR